MNEIRLKLMRIIIKTQYLSIIWIDNSQTNCQPRYNQPQMVVRHPSAMFSDEFRKRKM